MSPAIKRAGVQVLGGLTLASSTAYLAGFVLLFVPVFPAWAEFFSPRILLFLYVPVALCGVYFFARVQLARWMLKDGATGLVRQWCEPRMSYNFWLRGKREALIQRVLYAQALIRERAAPEAVHRVLWPQPGETTLPQRAPELVELVRWRMELALREDDLLGAKEIFEQGRDLLKPRVQRAALLASRAEVAQREKKFSDCKQYLKEARWADPTSRRARYVEILAMISQQKGDSDTLASALEELDTLRPFLCALIPGRDAEVLIWRARLCEMMQREEQAMLSRSQAAEAVARGLADRRAALMVEDECGPIQREEE